MNKVVPYFLLISVGVFIKFLYPFSCLIWGAGLLIWFLIGYGQFERFYQYKRCYANCFYNKNSWVYSWVTKKPLVMLVSSFVALPLSLSLISFVALASFSDFVFILVSMIITLVSFVFFEQFFRKHAADRVVNIVAKHSTVLLSMLIMVLTYSLVSFHLAVPEYLDPMSLSHTIELASYEAGSTCATTSYFLKFMHELEAISWFGMIVASSSVDRDYLVKMLWGLFFINHALVFAALARLQLELITIFRLKQG